MQVKLYLYLFTTFVSAVGLSSINTNGWIKKNKQFEVTILFISLSLIMGYLLTNFIIDFLSS